MRYAFSKWQKVVFDACKSQILSYPFFKK